MSVAMQATEETAQEASQEISEGLQVRKLHPHVGAEVCGVDLRQPLRDEVFEAIQDAFHQHSILVFRDQDISDDQQVAFSERFGELERTTFKIAADNPFVYQLSNIDEQGAVLPENDTKRTFLEVNGRWHTDSSFRETPALASALSGRAVPLKEGGDTEFASMRVGYQTLPAAKRAALDGLRARHSYAYTLSLFGLKHGVKSDELQAVPPAEHPLVRSDHPSGEKNLYVSGHINCILGMDEDDGLKLKQELIDWCTRAEFVYRHQWRQYDLVMWDNRCALHRATNIPATEPRLMHRTTVAGVGPAY
jgi:alpha-ketoglutarate-dependent 2,4-dichlorophenoxyacetate dioxygenase